MTSWKDQKRRCLSAGGLKKKVTFWKLALKNGHILEGIRRRADPKAGGVKKRSRFGRLV